MNKLAITSILLGLSSSVAFPQTMLTVDRVTVRVNTINVDSLDRGALWIEVSLNVLPPELIDHITTRADLEVGIRSLSVDEFVVNPIAATSRVLLVGQRKVTFKLRPDRKVLDLIQGGTEGWYLYVNQPVPLTMVSGASAMVTPNELKTGTASRMQISDAQLHRVIAAKGGERYLLANTIDAGRSVADKDSTTVEYFAVVHYARTVRWIQPPGIEWSWSLRARTSTNSRSPLNYVEIYPVRLSTFPLDKLRLGAELGTWSDQRFDSTFVTITLGGDYVSPDLIDLTGGYNRLRIKPIVGWGVRLYNAMDGVAGQNSSFTEAELFLTINYYVPVLDKFGLKLDGRLFLTGFDGEDASSDFEDLHFHYDLALLYELPVGEIKTMAKISAGENPITLERDDELIIGLLVDQLNLKGAFTQ